LSEEKQKRFLAEEELLKYEINNENHDNLAKSLRKIIKSQEKEISGIKAILVEVKDENINKFTEL